jgi:excisionase family DNA binding protein
MITVEQLAGELGLAPFTIRKYARQNLIPAIKVGRDWRFQSVQEVISTLAINKGNKTAKSAAMAMRRAA